MKRFEKSARLADLTIRLVEKANSMREHGCEQDRPIFLSVEHPLEITFNQFTSLHFHIVSARGKLHNYKCGYINEI